MEQRTMQEEAALAGVEFAETNPTEQVPRETFEMIYVSGMKRALELLSQAPGLAGN